MSNEKIFIVEDEIIVSMGIKRTLASLGYQIAGSAVSGEEAIKKVSQTQPDLVMMDIQLKGEMDGIDTAKIIHETLHIPVIFLTAYADSRTLKRAKLTMPFGYLVKPFQERELSIAVEFALVRSKMERRLRESESRFRGLAESIDDGIVIFENNTITFVNDNACRILGKPRKELLGTSHSEMEDHAPSAEPWLEDTSDLIITPMGVGVWITDADGNRRCIQKRSAYFRRGSAIPYRYIIMSDITDKIQKAPPAKPQASMQTPQADDPREMVYLTPVIDEMKNSVVKLLKTVSGVQWSDSSINGMDFSLTEIRDRLTELYSQVKILSKVASHDDREDLDDEMEETALVPDLDDTEESMHTQAKSLEDILNYLDSFENYNGIIKQADHSMLRRILKIQKHAILLPFIIAEESEFSRWIKRQAERYTHAVSDELKRRFTGEEPPDFLLLSDDLVPPVYAINFYSLASISENLEMISTVIPFTTIILTPENKEMLVQTKSIARSVEAATEKPVYLLISERYRYAVLNMHEPGNTPDVIENIAWESCFISKQLTDLISKIVSGYSSSQKIRS